MIVFQFTTMFYVLWVCHPSQLNFYKGKDGKTAQNVLALLITHIDITKNHQVGKWDAFLRAISTLSLPNGKLIPKASTAQKAEVQLGLPNSLKHVDDNRKSNQDRGLFVIEHCQHAGSAKNIHRQRSCYTLHGFVNRRKTKPPAILKS